MPTNSHLKAGIFVVAGFLAMVAALLLSGCAEDPPTIKAPDGQDAAASAATEKANPLVILTWDEYFSPEIISQFEERHGIPVEFVTFTNLEEMNALLRSRPADFDLLVASGGTVGDLIELDMLQPIHKERLPLIGNLDERFLNPSFDPENRYSIPYMWGTTLIAYRSDKISDPARSWKSLWNPDYGGRVLMVDDGFDIYAAALLANGNDLNSQDPAELEAATKLLISQVDKLGARFVDIFEVREKLLSGECWISTTYSSDAAILAEEEKNIDYFIPEEGAPLWIDSFVIPRESDNAEAAHRFLDFLCEPEVAALNSNELWSASVNREARPHLSKEILEDPTLYLKDDVMARCWPEAQTSPERQRVLNQGLKRVFDRVKEAEAHPPLSLLIWDNYLDPEIIRDFEKKTSSRVVVTEIENSEQLKQAIASQSSHYDVIVADEVSLKELSQLKLLQELDHVKLQGTPAVRGKTSFLASSTDPENRISVPYLWGLTVLVGRAEAIEGAEPSWSLIWREDLEVAVVDEPSDLLWIALLANGIEPAQATEQQIDEAASKLAARFPNLKNQMMGQSSCLDVLEAGEVDLVVAYNGDAAQRAALNPDIRVILPKEGAPLWVDNFAIPSNASSIDLAHQFIGYMSTPEISAKVAESLRYASPFPESRDFMDQGFLVNPIVHPDEDYMGKCSFARFPPPMERLVNQAIMRMITGRKADAQASREN